MTRADKFTSGLNSYKLFQFIKKLLRENRSISEREDRKAIEEAISSADFLEQNNVEDGNVF